MHVVNWDAVVVIVLVAPRVILRLDLSGQGTSLKSLKGEAQRKGTNLHLLNPGLELTCHLSSPLPVLYWFTLRGGSGHPVPATRPGFCHRS